MCLNDVGMAGGGWPGSTTTPRAIFASNISRFHIFSCPCTEWNLSNCKCWLTRLSSLDYLLLEVEYCAGKWWRQVVVAVVESRWVHLWICNQYTNNQKSLVDGWQQSVLFGETSRALQLHLTIKWTKSEEILEKNALADGPFLLNKYSAIFNSSRKSQENIISPLEMEFWTGRCN